MRWVQSLRAKSNHFQSSRHIIHVCLYELLSLGVDSNAYIRVELIAESGLAIPRCADSFL